MKLFQNISLTLIILMSMFMLSACSPEYIQQKGISSYNYGDYLYSTGSFKLLLETQPDNPNAYYWLGKNYLAAGDYDTAIINFKKAIDLSPQNTTYKTDPGAYYFELAKAYMTNYDYQEAAATLKKLNEINSTVCTTGVNLPICTEIYDYSERIKDAFELHNRFTYPQSEVSRKHRILSYLNIRDHNYDEAIKLAAKAIEEYPDNELAYYNIGIASGEKGQYDKAIGALRKAVGLPYVMIKGYLPMYISLAYYLEKDGQYDAAISAYNDAIEKAKNNSDYYNNYKSKMAIALSYYNLGKYDEALKPINEYLYKLEIGNVGLAIRDSYYLKSNFDNNHYIFSVIPGSPAEKAGLQFGDRIIAVDGQSVKGRSTEYILSQISGTEGVKVTLKIQRFKNPTKKDEEGIIFEKKLDREMVIDKVYFGNLADIYGLRSIIYRAKGQKERAQLDAEKAIEYNPESFNAKLAWGLANIDLENYNDALKILSTAKLKENERLYGFDVYYFFTPFFSDEELVKLGKAIAYLKLGKINEANNYIPTKEIPASAPPIYKEYLALTAELDKIAQNHNEKAANLYQKGFLKEALNEYTLALTYINNDKKEEEIINNLINILQEYPVAPTMSEEARKYMVRADLSLKQNDLSGALNECHKALKLAPYLPKVYYNIAGLNGGLKNYEKAINYMNFYPRLVPDAQDARDEITKWEYLLEKK